MQGSRLFAIGQVKRIVIDTFLVTHKGHMAGFECAQVVGQRFRCTFRGTKESEMDNNWKTSQAMYHVTGEVMS